MMFPGKIPFGNPSEIAPRIALRIAPSGLFSSVLSSLCKGPESMLNKCTSSMSTHPRPPGRIL